jgi:fumarate reductase flavoprotein subunit
MPSANPVLALGADEERRIESEYLRKTRGTEKTSALREAMQHTMEAGAGIYRTRVSLAEAADKIAEMQERYKAISMEDHSLAFNTQLIAALELGFLLDVAETILQCGLQREESRGAHQRIDFPDRDDKKFLAHSLVSRGENGRPVVSYLPVTITRWPPGKRVYGEQATDGGHDSH